LVFMLENSIYSVITPEGCAAILWRDNAKAPAAAEAMKMTAADAMELGAIDSIINEPVGGAHRDHDAMASIVKTKITESLNELGQKSRQELLDQRLQKFLGMGIFEEKKK